MNDETRLRNALQEIIRMAEVPLNERESPGSARWRADVRKLAIAALYPPESLTKEAV